jgi:hypothetical protein
MPFSYDWKLKAKLSDKQLFVEYKASLGSFACDHSRSKECDMCPDDSKKHNMRVQTGRCNKLNLIAKIEPVTKPKRGIDDRVKEVIEDLIYNYDESRTN